LPRRKEVMSKKNTLVDNKAAPKKVLMIDKFTQMNLPKVVILPPKRIADSEDNIKNSATDNNTLKKLAAKITNAIPSNTYNSINETPKRIRIIRR
jgi:hypothetical protein